MVNINKLRGKMVEMCINAETLAGKIGVDKSTLYRKMNNGGDTFTIGEANRIVQILSLTADEAVAIFFK